MPSPGASRWIFAIAMVVALGTPVARGDANSDFEDRREESRKSFEGLISDIPSLPERGIGSLLRIAVENRTITIRTPLKNSPDEGFIRVKASDLGVTALVRVTGRMAADETSLARPASFQFNAFDYGKPHRIVTLSVCIQPAFCNISRVSKFPGDEFENVTFTQWAGDNQADGGSVELSVNAGHAGAMPVNLDLHAADFFSFNRLHPAESDRYLRPMLRELKQENAFAPDPLIAFQVFAELWHADAAIDRQVQALLAGLKNDDFRARGEAQSGLEKLGSAGAAVLMHVERRSLTPEQNARVDLVLGSYPQLSKNEARRLRGDRRFLLDCLFSDDATLRKAALRSLQEMPGPQIQFDVEAPLEARAAAIDQLREKLLDKPDR